MTLNQQYSNMENPIDIGFPTIHQDSADERTHWSKKKIYTTMNQTQDICTSHRCLTM